MSEEKKDLTLSDNSSEPSTLPEGTGKEPSSPSDASAGNEDRVKALESKVEELTGKYAASSTEAKRLKSLVDESSESLQEKEDYIQSLEKALEERDGKDEEKSEEKKPDIESKPVEKKPEEKKPELPPYLTEEGQKRAMKKLLEQDRKATEEADKQYKAALVDFPRLKNETFAKLVSAKMKLESVGVKEACKKVEEDLSSLDSKEEDNEPFVEGGRGKSTTQEHLTEEDKIRNSLKRDVTSTNLPGMI